MRLVKTPKASGGLLRLLGIPRSSTALFSGVQLLRADWTGRQASASGRSVRRIRRWNRRRCYVASGRAILVAITGKRFSIVADASVEIAFLGR